MSSTDESSLLVHAVQVVFKKVHNGADPVSYLALFRNVCWSKNTTSPLLVSISFVIFICRTVLLVGLSWYQLQRLFPWPLVSVPSTHVEAEVCTMNQSDKFASQGGSRSSPRPKPQNILRAARSAIAFYSQIHSATGPIQ